MNTTASELSIGGRRRRKHSAEFKAQAVAACRHSGVSIAAVAMANGVNANLLRRWMIDAEQIPNSRSSSIAPSAQTAPSFVPVALAERVAPQDIRIELRRGTTAVTVSWPAAAAVECATWMRELLR